MNGTQVLIAIAYSVFVIAAIWVSVFVIRSTQRPTDDVDSDALAHGEVRWGLIVVSLGFGRSFTGGLRSLAAGEVTEFTQAVDEARRGALFRMVEHAKGLGGNAVVGVRFDSNALGESGALAEFVAYGSAVMVKTG